MPYVPAKRRYQAAELAKARAKKKLMLDPHGNNKSTEGVEMEDHVASLVTNDPTPQLNKPRSLTPQANSRPHYRVRVKFDPRSHKPLEPALRRHFRTRMGASMVESNPESPLPATEPPEAAREPDDNTTTGMDIDSPSNVDLKYDPKRLPLSRINAEAALLKITRILNVPRDKGRGYKECKLDKVTRTRCQSIASCLYFYRRPGTTFIDASVDAAIGIGRSLPYARKIRSWVRRFITAGELPRNMYGRSSHSALEDEDISNEIKLHLRTKGKYITAEDVVQFVNDSSTQARLGLLDSVSVRTAQRWLKRMGYQWRREKRGQYFDGHEREDVVKYRQEVFVPKWKELEPFMPSWDEIGAQQPLSIPNDQQEVTVWFHDATTAYAHERQDIRWVHADEDAILMKKGLGASVMFADYISAKHGFLRSQDGESNARKILYAGKNRDGYLSNDDICAQFKDGFQLAKYEYPSERHIFVYDNARIHTKRLPGTPSARLMTKGQSDLRVQIKNSQGVQIKIRMNNPCFPDGSEQQLYLPGPNGKFKGMEALLQERGYDTTGLKAECRGFKCVDQMANCCCRRILFRILDLDGGVRSKLELLANELGTEVIFLPKFHCELNPIEQCWGYAKRLYRMAPPSKLAADVEKYMLKALDSIPIASIRRFVTRSRRFIDAYARGLDGPNAAASEWARRRFKGHRTTPEHILI
ncbi:Son of sevenless homolog 2 [Rhizoctonia solani]|uniref:Son of sevenless homolog 2 n=1 Tax=Rhizoctonia solani TaxID=456999 RepID=A0A0K6G108_9AGAM|nr:Son of sevenless homolog 2 [Rhizoctonia solani]